MNGGNLLARRFAAAWFATGAHTHPAPVFERLCAAYGQPHRHYHTLAHIEHTLAWLDWTCSVAGLPHEIALALWFHDYVYEPLRKDNEAASAQAARQILLEAGVAHDAVARIEAMILATAQHAAQEGDAALLVDIDLAILGAQPEEFARFEEQVRQEYRMFDDAAYARGRASVLSKLAARRPLFATALMAEELEARARSNLSRAVARWNLAATPDETSGA